MKKNLIPSIFAVLALVIYLKLSTIRCFCIGIYLLIGGIGWIVGTYVNDLIFKESKEASEAE